uniref:Uncharacterized protein n=1 Tax=Sphaerodactylus townsendi TaxID=933632 RepID=A0ACB8FZV6_9SAUR
MQGAKKALNLELCACPGSTPLPRICQNCLWGWRISHRPFIFLRLNLDVFLRDLKMLFLRCVTSPGFKNMSLLPPPLVTHRAEWHAIGGAGVGAPSLFSSKRQAQGEALISSILQLSEKSSQQEGSTQVNNKKPS